MTWTCRLQRNAVLYDLAPPRTDRRGRPALKGKRLGLPADLAATATWRRETVIRYGRVEVVWLASEHCLWYGAFGAREVQVILVRDSPTGTRYDLALVSTDLTTARASIVGRYADRWSIEVLNHEAKHILGVGQTRNRVRKAVERTVPFGLLTISIIVLWYVEHGHHPADIAAQRARSPWYATKTEPSFEDMLIKLRRVLIVARFSPVRPAQPTPDGQPPPKVRNCSSIRRVFNHPRVVRNDWGVLRPPEIGAWTPTLTVSLIIPAYQCADSLALTLASLAQQTYPAELLDVVVVDDGSVPPLELPKLRPERCRIVRASDVSSGWGRSNALHVGASHSSGEIMHWLDADMVVVPQHVEAQARWHHLIPDAVTLGYKRFVDDGWATPDEVAEACTTGTIGRLFPREETESHDYVEKIIESSDRLRSADHLGFRAHVGATAALRRGLYEATGGLRTELRLGEDTEFGFRLAQAGAVFIPEPAAQSWHMGASSMMRDGELLRRYNRPFLADLMPYPRWLREGEGRAWAVPLVTAVVPADGPFEQVSACVDALVGGDERDVRVLLVGPFDSLTDERRPVLADPLLDVRLLAATYRSEPRVSLAAAAPGSVFPSPYRLNVPSHLAVGPSTVRRLVAEADRWQVGLVRVLPEGRDRAADVIELWRTSAVSRAMRVRRSDEPLTNAVAEIHGQRWVSGTEFDSTDLIGSSTVEPTPTRTSPMARRAAAKRSTLPPGTRVVEVAGIRSWWRATRFVARLGLAELRRRARQSYGRH